MICFGIDQSKIEGNIRIMGGIKPAGEEFSKDGQSDYLNFFYTGYPRHYWVNYSSD